MDRREALRRKHRAAVKARAKAKARSAGRRARRGIVGFWWMFLSVTSVVALSTLPTSLS